MRPPVIDHLQAAADVMAAVEATRPFSTIASFVVPPPMSMLRMRLP